MRNAWFSRQDAVLMNLAQIGISIYKQNLYQVKSCLDSCLAQENCMITCRTDGPDACDIDVIKYLECISSEKDNLQFIVGAERLGNFGSLNRIFAISETPFLCQVDADDWLAPGALRICIQQLEANPRASFLYTDCLEVDEHGTPIQIGGRSLNEYTEMNSLTQFIPFHLRLVRRNYFDRVGGYNANLKYTGDYDISLKLAEVGEVGYVNRPLYFYRIHSQNSSFANFQEVNNEVLSICNAAIVRRGLVDRYKLIQDDSGEMKLIPVQG